MSDNYVYILEGKIYINLTNLCTNDCVFCIRDIKADVVGTDLRLDSETVDLEEIKNQLDALNPSDYPETVFCGYGEPTIKLDELKEIAKYIREKYPDTKIRVNTNGQADIIHKRNVVSELAGLIDRVSVSFNAENEALYNKISCPKLGNAYKTMQDFITCCVENGIETTATIVTGYKNYGVDKEQCRKMIESLGAKFRERPWLDNGY
jgi:TatD DNase family protein